MLDGTYLNSAMAVKERTGNGPQGGSRWCAGPRPMSVIAEQSFPVRVRVMIPPRGLGLRLNEMHDWLRQHAAENGGHFVGSDRGPPDAALGGLRGHQGGACVP